MAAPTITYWKISGGGSINLLGAGGGASGSALGSSDVFDFGNVEAGMWSIPQVLLVEFAGNTANNIDLRLYDTDANVDDPIVTTLNENLFANYTNDPAYWSVCWNVHIDLKATYVSPASISTNPSTSEINGWSPLLHIADMYRLDTHMPAPGNDGRSGAGSLLTLNVNGDVSRHLTNFYIYIAGKPRSAAAAGENLGWGIRTSYTYPSA